MLQTRNISIRDRFFELGGHSLLAVKVFNRMEQRLGVRLPLAAQFEAPTIEKLTKRLTENDSDNRESWTATAISSWWPAAQSLAQTAVDDGQVQFRRS